MVLGGSDHSISIGLDELTRQSCRLATAECHADYLPVAAQHGLTRGEVNHLKASLHAQLPIAGGYPGADSQRLILEGGFLVLVARLADGYAAIQSLIVSNR